MPECSKCLTWIVLYNSPYTSPPWWIRVKNLLAVQETWVPPLGCDDPLEEDMAAHPGILAWRIPWTEKPGGLRSMGSPRVRHDWVTEHAHRMTLGPFLHMSAPEYSEPYPVGLLRELKKRSPSSLMAHTWWLTLIWQWKSLPQLSLQTSSLWKENPVF